MELERMRWVLAEKCMGWKPIVSYLDGSPYAWDGTSAGGLPFTMYVDDWKPWDSWGQTGLVIEAMRKRGWPAFSARQCVDAGWYASFGRRYVAFNNSVVRWWADGPEVYADTFPAAASLAAYRALESEAADDVS